MILVTPETFEACVQKLMESPQLSVDSETTGFFAWKRDRLFSIQFSDEHEDYYFNFNDYDPEEPKLSFSDIKRLQPLFENRTLFLQNAKFDMAFLWKEGIRFELADIHDTEVGGRLIRNDHMKYSLDEQAKRDLGEAKDDAVMEWLKKNKCFKSVDIPGKDTVYKNFHFDKVPYDIITRYGCKDTRLTYQLGMLQIAKIKEMERVGAVMEMEKELTHACFEIERVGIQIDKEYCDEAIRFESACIQKAERSFTDQTGVELTDSGKCLGPIFEGLGFKPGTTETGEYEVTDAFLQTVSHPLGEVVREYRDARKRANTYFKSYVYFADANGVVHANMKQSGTATGRFSYMDPNLQNIPAEDPSKYPVRRAFVPREGFFFVSIDYQQMEFRMMLDEASQHDLIEKIKNGHDPHDATAELTGLTRKSAKTLNFGLLYGMGKEKLGKAIGVSTEDAAKFKRQYFQALPMVENFILQCSGVVRTRHTRDPGSGWLKTWFGRRGYFNDPKWAYKAANFKIQGGCADVVKLAMIKLHKFLRDKKSRMVLQVHDEILFEIAFEEKSLITEILEIMETAYPHRFIPLTCSLGYSLKSFYDIVDEDPRTRDLVGEKRGNSIQRESRPAPEGASEYLVREGPTKNH